MRPETEKQIPLRSEIPSSYQWDLSSLFKNDEEWDKYLNEFQKLTEQIEDFKGSLGKSVENFLAFLRFYEKIGILDERLGHYAFLKTAEDLGDSKNQERQARYMRAASEAETKASFFTPELRSIPDETIESFLKDDRLENYRIFIRKLLRYKPHILSESEERILAMQEEANQTASKSFSSLTNVDLDFGTVKTPEGERVLSQSTFSSLLEHQERGVREQAYKQFYGIFDGHKQVLSSLYTGSIHLDYYKARVRNFPSTLAARLFPDNVPESVYRSLIEGVSRNLPTLHNYYRLRSKFLRISPLAHFDVKVPLVPDLKIHYSYKDAVDLILEALSPLGSEYCDILKNGLYSGWVDRYENKGKRSGAFSAGSYSGNPYILMNYKEDLLRDVFTLCHEGGHSMHSYYSSANNPFFQYNYTIFEAEVASTFNEHLLFRHLLSKSNSEKMKTYLINKRIDDIIGTLYRQTMFAEYELHIHELAESGTPLSIDRLREEYRNLLEKYFGPDVKLEDISDLEGLRIPHFYRAFYVYKYATGISAAIYLAERLLAGGKKEQNEYFTFLKSGGSIFPLESLAAAGVDMSKPDPVEAALAVFADLIKQLESRLENGKDGQ